MSPRPRSATDDGTPGPASAGERFARALAAKDADALCALLAGQVDFQAPRPGTTGRPTPQARRCVAYRVRVRRSGRDYLVEQQVYYRAEGPRITWMRVLCSDYQPVPR